MSSMRRAELRSGHRLSVKSFWRRASATCATALSPESFSGTLTVVVNASLSVKSAGPSRLRLLRAVAARREERSQKPTSPPVRAQEPRKADAGTETLAKDTDNDPDEPQWIILYRLPGKSLSVLAQVLYGELRNIQRKSKKNPVYVKQAVLADNWGVTPKTVRKALRELEREKLITPHPGSYGEVTCYEIL